MTVPIQLLFVFVFPHLLPTLLDHASHALPSFLSLTNPQSHWSEFSEHHSVPGVW